MRGWYWCYTYGFAIVTTPDLHPVCAGLSWRYLFTAGLLALASQRAEPPVGLESLVTGWDHVITPMVTEVWRVLLRNQPD